MGQRRGGQNAGSPLGGFAAAAAGFTGQQTDVLPGDELLPGDAAEGPEIDKPGGRRRMRARQQRPDSAYIGTPYGIDRALLQQQQQQGSIEPLAQVRPAHKPSLSTGQPPYAPSPPPLPSLFYSNSLYGPDNEHLAPSEVLSPSPSPPATLHKHTRSASAAAAAAAAAASAAGHSPRMRPSPKTVAVAQHACVGVGSTRHSSGHNGVEDEEGDAGTTIHPPVGLLQQLSQGKLAPKRDIASILDTLDKRGAAKSGGGGMGGDGEGVWGHNAGVGAARRLSDPEQEVDGVDIPISTGAADGGKPLLGRMDTGHAGHLQEGRGSPDLTFAGAAAIQRVEDALLWKDPWLSVRALAGGLYLIVCAQQAVRASKYLRPTTLTLAVAFLILVANLAAAAYRAFRHAAHRRTANHHHHFHHHRLVGDHTRQPLQDQMAHADPFAANTALPQPQSNRRRPHGSSDGGSSKQSHGRQHRARQRWGEVRNGIGEAEGEALLGGDVLGQNRAEQEGEGDAGGHGEGVALGGGVRDSRMMRHAVEQERVVYEWTHLLLSALTSWSIPLAAACCAVVYRALSGRRLATTVLVAGSLWLGMLLSELDVMSPSTFCGFLYTTLFVVPASYLRCRQAMDGVVETILRFIARLLVSGDRASLLLTTSALLLVFCTTSFSLVSRVSLALVCAMCVLVYTTLFRPSSRQAARA